VFCDIAADLIGPDVRLYWDQAVYKKSEQPQPFPWHQDNGYTYLEPQNYLTCWVALTDATEANGCPWVVPGLHRMGTLRHHLTERGWRCFEEAPTAVPVPARAGSIVVFSSLTPHATGPNLTDQVRKAYIVQFAPDGARSLRIDPHSDNRESNEQNDSDRQFFVVRQGVRQLPV
jgi:ectoine hydroxylase-related dioxygenase (phytanoyl-CoA dioxygenase family)